MTSHRFTPTERLALTSLAGAYALRMLGLYLVLPVLSPYAASLRGGATFWVGMAVGSYGLSQMIFQVPFGILSDYWGRRRTIVVGLLLFSAGSALAALATTAPLLVLGRFFQGMGAISAVVVALAADLARPEVRQRAMAILGVTIGVAFGAGLMAGPALSVKMSVPGLLYLCALLGVLSAAAVLIMVPRQSHQRHRPRATVRQTLAVFQDPNLLKVNVAMMSLHLGITALFVVLPLQLEALLPRQELWRVYAPAIVLGLIGISVTAEVVDRHHLDRGALAVGGALLLAGALLLRSDSATVPGVTLGLVVFVAGFAIVEPILPALITHYAAPAVRGTAAGAFSMSQFFGAGLGGLAGAFFLSHNKADIYWLLAGLAGVLLVVALRLPEPRGWGERVG